MDREAWRAAVHGVAQGWTRLSDFTLTFHFPALASGFFITSATWEAHIVFYTSRINKNNNIYIVSHFGEGNGKPLQYSCLENPMDGGAW